MLNSGLIKFEQLFLFAEQKDSRKREGQNLQIRAQEASDAQDRTIKSIAAY